MGGVALHGLDQVGDQILALLQLDIDVGEGVVGALPQGDEAVVSTDHHHHQDGGDDQNDDEGDHGVGSPEATLT
jgi:hypothetical protein